MRRRAILGAAGTLLIAAALILAARGWDASEKGGSRAPAASGEVGGRVPPVSLAGVEGERIAVPASRPGALFFTVSSCLSCIPSAKALGELKARFGERVDAVWIGIDPTEAPQQVRARRRSMGDPPYSFALDESGELTGQYSITALGTTVVYDATGTVVARLIEPDREELAAAFRKAGLL